MPSSFVLLSVLFFLGFLGTSLALNVDHGKSSHRSAINVCMSKASCEVSPSGAAQKDPFNLPRNPTHELHDPFETPRLVFAFLHLSIPVAFVPWVGGGAAQVISFMGLTAIPMESGRALALTSLSALYGLRWALVALINTRRWESSGTAIMTSIVHGLIHQILPALITCTGQHASTKLTSLDKSAVALAVFAGILQQGSELQRFVFRRDPANRGKLFRGGLFAYAQFINHTGHILGDLANALLVLCICTTMKRARCFPIVC